MLSETVFRSEDLPPGERFDAWRDLMNRTHAPMDLSSDHAADFHAHQRLITLGAVSVWPARFQQLVFRRTPKLIRRSDPEVYHLSLLVKGDARVSWGRENAAYEAFDFHSNDSMRPYEIWTGSTPITSVGVEVPKDLLPMPRARADRAVARRMSARDGIGRLLARFLTQLASGAGSYRPSDGPRLGVVVNDLVGALFARTLDDERLLEPETRTRTLLLGIRDFIAANLHDGDLSPAVIAAAHHISVGYLHRLFRAEGVTVGSHVRRLRLEGARRDLADPALAATPVHLVAARWGYPRAADFTRAFRTAYGTTPTEHRAAPVR